MSLRYDWTLKRGISVERAIGDTASRESELRRLTTDMSGR